MWRFPSVFFSFESDCSGPGKAGDSLNLSASAAGLFFFLSLLLALSSRTVADSPDPPSVITEQQAYVRKASSEAALSSRAAISAFFVRTEFFSFSWSARSLFLRVRVRKTVIVATWMHSPVSGIRYWWSSARVFVFLVSSIRRFLPDSSVCSIWNIWSARGEDVCHI